MSDWEVALDKQLDGWLFYNSDKGQAYLTGYTESVEAAYEQDRLDGTTRTMARILPQVLWQSDPIYVTSEMCDLLDAAWPSFQPEALTREDLLVPAGFVWLARPVFTIDVRGNRMAHRALAWYSVQATNTKRDGLVLYTFADPEDRDDYWEPGGRGSGLFGSAPAVGFMTALWYGEGWDSEIATTDTRSGDEEIDAEMAKVANDEMARFTMALWRLLNQRIAVGLKRPPSRATRRRFARASKAEPKYITVVTLRRPKNLGEDGDHHPVNWSHRWLVSGHWRWQPYKDGTVKQVWISPYIKGPDDAPLVIRGARVFRLAR